MNITHVLNELAPSGVQQTLLENQVGQGKTSGPIYIINMLKFRDKAAYPPGFPIPAGVETGRQAVEEYLKNSAGALARVGGELVFAGVVSALRIGQVESLWDEIVIVKYPSQKEFLALIEDVQWKKANIHRVAGIEGQLNIETLSSTASVYAGATVK